MKPPSEWKIPEWMEDMPDHLLMTSKELSTILGCCPQAIANSASGKDHGYVSGLPKPDLVLDHRRSKAGKRFKWRLGTIRKWIMENQS